jgi:hypothetical protein
MAALQSDGLSACALRAKPIFNVAFPKKDTFPAPNLLVM